MFQTPDASQALVAGLVAIDVLTTGVAIVAYLSLHRAARASRALDHIYLPAVSTLKRLQSDLSETLVLARGMFMHEVAGRPDRVATARDELLERIAQTRGDIAAYESLDASTPAELAAWSSFVPSWETWRLLLLEYIEKLRAGGTSAAYQVSLGPNGDCLPVMSDSLQRCIDLNSTYADAADDRAAASQRLADITLGLASAASVALAGGIASVSNPAATGRLLQSVVPFLH